jgi:hypothetical protein
VITVSTPKIDENGDWRIGKLNMVRGNGGRHDRIDVSEGVERIKQSYCQLR